MHGSTWSLIVSGGDIDKIDLAIGYLMENVVNYNNQISYITESKSNAEEIKLGGLALTVIALTEYMEAYDTDIYLDISEKLGNGILEMQNEDGSYIHVLNLDYTVKDEYRTVYYDGEATFALCKLYGITGEKKYLDGAEKALDYFIENDYTQYTDHWISYATNEITKYVDNEEYYELALRNVADGLDKIYNNTDTTPTQFELLMKGLETYNRMIDKGIYIDYLSEFPIDDFIETIEYRAKYQLNSFIFPEIAMYLSNPSKYINTFRSGERIRIDDIQHSILGFYEYSVLEIRD